ncbi:hypothetical protein CIL03_05730 [Virgibacillus indicus]|uniref:NAD(P)-binding domain-containing protein n=1 Tax=Virgibacillus indicus TaxID=2024554 RepID=A0A265NFR1_9BACI|nr:hypothetical protein [Virgibacillus indicus]OZU90637.1 hypothetical protein CIL03_05730 [Virgibacillus indicus]
MSFLVAGCNHWIGFHIVNELLEEGYTVAGILNEDGNENLPLYFGRNSSFSMVKADSMNNYDTAIIIDEIQSTENIQADRIVKIGGTIVNNEKVTLIKIPLLYGEWMKMNEKGMFRDKAFIPFDSDDFEEKAIYIKDFTNGLIQWLKFGKLPPHLHVISAKNNEKEGVKLENSIYLRDNRPNKEKLMPVLDHFKKFKELYD